MKLDVLFKILAVVFIGIAAFFLWRGSQDGTFVTAILGCVCFFLSLRFQIVERNKMREADLQKGKERSEARNPESEIK